jgi:hypothetical protein
LSWASSASRGSRDAAAELLHQLLDAVGEALLHRLEVAPMDGAVEVHDALQVPERLELLPEVVARLELAVDQAHVEARSCICSSSW